MRAIFDIEADGLLDSITQIHCIVIQDADTGKVYDFRPGEIEDGLKLLADADQLIGHNIIGYDIPAIQKLHPGWSYKGEVFDTLTMARVIWPEIKQSDFKRAEKGTLPKQMIGLQSLESWGYRLGNYKGDFQGPWDTWTPEMHDYCIQDVAVTADLLSRIEAKNHPERSTKLEHSVQWIISRQIETGFRFDEKAATRLYAALAGKREEKRAALSKLVEPWYVPAGKFKPKRDNARLGYTKDAVFTKVKLLEFNAGSDIHVADRLQKLYGWKPEEFTPSGQPKVDDDIIGRLPYPIAKEIAVYKMLDKRCGQIAEGKQAWLKQVKNGRLYGFVNPNGAVTGRATHSHPNIGQVPAAGKPYGKECRALFIPDEGFEMVGVDLSGLELRCLGHYLARWDEGAYAHEVVNGDPHTMNQEAAGLPTRDNAKTFIYGWLYGAGAAKIGKIIGKGPQAGRKLITRFLKRLPAVGYLKKAVERAAKRGYLIGLDGRKVTVRSAHAALNTLLQSAGALISKQWMIQAHLDLKEAGYVEGRDYMQLAWIHDELQLQARKGLGHEIGTIVAGAAPKAGEFFKLRCPIAAEYKVGNSWAETH